MKSTLIVLVLALVVAGQRSTIRNSGDPDNAPRISTSSPLAGGTESTAYSQTVQLQSGVGRPPMTWSINGGALPTGLSINSSTGTISGTPSVAGTYTFTVRVVDALGGANERSLSITIAAGGCTTTISSGANLNTEINNVTAGGTLCLNSGTYTTGTTITATKASQTTVKSVSGVGATIPNLSINGAQRITFDHLTVTNLSLSNNATNFITVSNSVQTANTMASYWNVGCQGWSGSKTIVFDGNSHINTGDAGTNGQLEGRFSFDGSSGSTANCGGVQVKNSAFSGANPYCSDGLFIQAGNVHVGPNNHFSNLPQTGCAAHIDSIQDYGSESGIVVDGNYFESSAVSLGWYDQPDPPDTLGWTVTNNVFVDGWLPIGGHTNVTMAHNTFIRTGVYTSSKSGEQRSQWIFQNNILDDNSEISEGGSPVLCGSQCIVRYNLTSGSSTIFRDDGNNISGTAVYSGTLSFANWANYLLAGGSPGKSAGNDGQDMGVLCYGGC